MLTVPGDYFNKIWLHGQYLIPSTSREILADKHPVLRVEVGKEPRRHGCHVRLSTTLNVCQVGDMCVIGVERPNECLNGGFASSINVVEIYTGECLRSVSDRQAERPSGIELSKICG